MTLGRSACSLLRSKGHLCLHRPHSYRESVEGSLSKEKGEEDGMVCGSRGQGSDGQKLGFLGFLGALQR